MTEESYRPGWYPDPTGHHEYRYYDGDRWTDHVSDAGALSEEPVDSPSPPGGDEVRPGAEGAVASPAPTTGGDHVWSRKPPDERRPLLSSRLLWNTFEWRHPWKVLGIALLGVIVIAAALTAVFVATDSSETAGPVPLRGTYEGGAGELAITLVVSGNPLVVSEITLDASCGAERLSQTAVLTPPVAILDGRFEILLPEPRSVEIDGEFVGEGDEIVGEIRAGECVSDWDARRSGTEASASPTPEVTAEPAAEDPMAFTTDRVLEVEGISEIVGQGTIGFSLGDEPETVIIELDAIDVPIVDGMGCIFCVSRVELAPDVSVAVPGFFQESPPGGDYEAVSQSATLSMVGPLRPDTASGFIVAGAEGAVLEKVGAGFRLISGSARLEIVEAADAPTTPANETTTETPNPALPTYSEIATTYPPDAQLCTTKAGISGRDDGGYEFGGYGDEQASISIRNGEMQFFCYGAQYVVTGPLEGPDGEQFEIGALLTVDENLDLVEVSSFE